MELTRLTDVPSWFWRAMFIVALFGLIVLGASKCYADPVARAEGQGVVITIYSEPCALSEVTNLPRRATWQEGGKLYEGCAGSIQELGVAVMYFAGDRTVTAVPLAVFERVSGA